MQKTYGRLYIVSVGIGDPENMTIRAEKIIRSSDIIVGMKFICENIAGLIRDKAVIDAGHCLFTPISKQNQDASEVYAREAELRKLIDDALIQGKTVSVLDFGDPMMFGPQVGYLAEFAHYNPVVIAGISSVNAANALFRRPILTGNNTGMLITTLAGFKDKKPPYPDIIVFFMMKTGLDEFIAEMKKNFDPLTPLALVFHAGFTGKEYIIESTLEGISEATSHLEEIPWDYLAYIGKGLKRPGK